MKARRLAVRLFCAMITPLAGGATRAFVALPDADGTRIAIHETTLGEFRRFVAATGHDATGNMFTLGAEDHDWAPRGRTWADPGFAQDDTHPVVGVNLADARDYAAWLSAEHRAAGLIAADEHYRLPTDREWSTAAGLGEERGATPEERMAFSDTKYPWGSDWPPPAGFGNYAGTESAEGKPSWWGTIPGGYTDAWPRTSPVGTFPSNALGIFDLSGNVWEWVDEPYTTSALARVTRGGCWGSDRPAYLLLAKRQPTFAHSRNDELGFRLVLAKGELPTGEPAGGSLSELTPVRVELDWIANAQFAGLLLAVERGWYREAGLDVTVVPVNQETMQTIEPVVAGKGISIGVADGSALLRARAGGAPVQAFATMFQASPIGIVTLESRGFESVAELKGKRIGIHAYNRPQLEKMLASAGLTLEDVEPVVLGNDHDSLPAGKVDAQVAYVIDEKVAF
jgi:formylglycine-generating enzyme required for sulfatase activity